MSLGGRPMRRIVERKEPKGGSLMSPVVWFSFWGVVEGEGEVVEEEGALSKRGQLPTDP